MIQRHLILFAMLAALPHGLNSQDVKRPAIVGVAHIGLKTNDLAAARNFYGRDLGFEEPFTVDKPSGGLMLTYFKVNDHQYIEIFPELKEKPKTGYLTSPSRRRMSNNCGITWPAAA